MKNLVFKAIACLSLLATSANQVACPVSRAQIKEAVISMIDDVQEHTGTPISINSCDLAMTLIRVALFCDGWGCDSDYACSVAVKYFVDRGCDLDQPFRIDQLSKKLFYGMDQSDIELKQQQQPEFFVSKETTLWPYFTNLFPYSSCVRALFCYESDNASSQN